MGFTITASFLNNLQSSVEAFLNTNVVVPYNTAVASTNYNKTCQIMLPPDDEGIIAAVPAIVMELPQDNRDPYSTGFGDGEVWKHTTFRMTVYPGLSTDTNGTQKASIASTQVLRSLFELVTTANSLTVSDYSNPLSPTALGGAFIVAPTRIINIKGRAALALHRHRFDFELTLRYNVHTLNG